MSWFKFWSKKSKSKEEEYKKEFRRSESLRIAEAQTEAEREKQRLKHTLSISRSGRFKQKKRERGAIVDQQDFFSGAPDKDNSENNSSRSQNTTCKDMNQVPSMNNPQPQLV